MGNLVNPYRFSGASSSLLTDLVSWWSLDETSGTRVDSHGSNDLTDNNTVTYATGMQGNATLHVAANSEYLSAAHDANLVMGNSDFTAAGWVKFSSSSSSQAFILGQGEESSGNDGWGLIRRLATDKVQAIARNSANSANVTTTSEVVGYDTWFFFVLQYSSDVLSLELNRGTPQTTALTGGGYASGVDEMRVGLGTVAYLDGSVDEVAVWRRLLTDAEKNELYNSGAGMTYPG